MCVKSCLSARIDTAWTQVWVWILNIGCCVFFVFFCVGLGNFICMFVLFYFIIKYKRVCKRTNAFTLLFACVRKKNVYMC